MTELKLMYKDITEDKSDVMFMWLGQELTIKCKNLDIIDYETGNKLSVSNNYNILFEHCKEILIKLLDILDVNLFDAWDIFYNQETFAYIEKWQSWENVESINDLNLKITKYDESANKVKEFIEDIKDTFIDI